MKYRINMKDYKINPDEELVGMLRQGMKENGGYCPCELIYNEDTKCICKVMRETGECRCGLFVPKYTEDTVNIYPKE